MPIEFTSRDFDKGFWYDRRDENFPPAGLSDPAEYSGEETLSITGAPSKRWVKILPSLENVRILWVSDKISQLVFEAICEMHGLEALWLKWSGIRSLESLSKLKKLQSLPIGSSTQIESITPVARLKQLKWLELENIKKIQDISPIGDCPQLLGLAIDGSMWTTQKVKNLGPLSRLSGLKYLSITNLRAADRTLRPLFDLHKLQRLRAAKWWAAVEVEELIRSNPRLKI